MLATCVHCDFISEKKNDDYFLVYIHDLETLRYCPSLCKYLLSFRLTPCLPLTEVKLPLFLYAIVSFSAETLGWVFDAGAETGNLHCWLSEEFNCVRSICVAPIAVEQQRTWGHREKAWRFRDGSGHPSLLLGLKTLSLRECAPCQRSVEESCPQETMCSPGLLTSVGRTGSECLMVKKILAPRFYRSNNHTAGKPSDPWESQTLSMKTLFRSVFSLSLFGSLMLTGFLDMIEMLLLNIKGYTWEGNPTHRLCDSKWLANATSMYIGVAQTGLGSSLKKETFCWVVSRQCDTSWSHMGRRTLASA